MNDSPVGPVKLGILRRIEARTAWVHEAHAFTPWLAANLGLLGESIGLDLEIEATEVSVGDFSVDIVAKDLTTGRPVIVENQLEPTDHSHLGQLLTYASGTDAAYVVWVSVRFRNEHRQALDWLNAHTNEGTDFFGVELELLQIDDSPMAPHFKLVAQPNEWQKSVRQTGSTSAPSELNLRYQRLFSEVLARFKAQRPGLTSASRVGPQNWFNFSAGRSGFAFGWAVISGGQLRVELYIDPGDRDTNKAFFDALRAQAQAIEGSLGAVIWDRLDQRRASRIGITQDMPTDPPFETNEQLISWAANKMVEMTDVLRPIVKTLAPLPAAVPSS